MRPTRGEYGVSGWTEAAVQEWASQVEIGLGACESEKWEREVVVLGRLGAVRKFKDCGMLVDYEGGQRIKQSRRPDEAHSSEKSH